MYQMPLDEQIARIYHAAHKAYCETIGDFSHRNWDEAPQRHRDDSLRSVRFQMSHVDAPASIHHDQWLADKEKSGWKYGPVKDESKKEHPMMIPYEQLPREERIKDHLLVAIVRAFALAGKGASA